jgi:RNA 3'-terminal phosphate cyclase
MPDVATPNQAEREFETGTDEAFKNANVTGAAGHNENQRVTYANIKRTYDVYQDLDIQAARQAQVEQTRLNQIANQALQNAVETANMVGKQAIRHADVAADALWTDELNPVTRGSGANLTAGSVPANRATDVAAAGAGVSAEAVAAAVAKQVDASVTPVIAALQQIVQALATATTAIGNVVNQAQPKTA